MARNMRTVAGTLSEDERTAWRRLQSVPNVGPAIAYDLLRLGVWQIEDLRDRDPDELYEELGILDGVRQDPCVRDVFASAVAYAKTGEAVPWWHFTPERKGERSPD